MTARNQITLPRFSFPSRSAVRFLCVATAMLSSTPGSAQQVLKPGDSLHIVVWRQPELTGRLQVSADGSLSHPLYRNVAVAGASIDSIRQRLATMIEKYVQNPEFVAEPYFRVFVSGEVRLPGAHFVPLSATVLQALAAAGGTSVEARLDRLILVRDGVPKTFDLTNFADPIVNSPVLSNDQIVVSRRRHILRDYVGPIAGIIGATAAVASVLLR